MAGEHMSFHWADYLLFGLSLAMGIIVGLVSMFSGGRQKTSVEYLLGGRNMNALTVGTSMLVTTLNAVYLLGGTAEVYYRGAIMALSAFAMLIKIPMVAFIYVPVWRKVNVVSCYEYLERRFHCRAIRLWGAFLFSMKLILFLSVVLYAPSMALSQVTGINMDVAVLVCGVVCGIYTSMGGLKAVIWTDTIQAVIMLVGLLVLITMGTLKSGGAVAVIDKASELGRFNFNSFSFHPQERHTVQTLVVGSAVTWSTFYLSDQTMVQRFMAAKSLRVAQWSAVVCFLVGNVCTFLVTSVGVIAAVYYADCDPLEGGMITKGDQMLPYFFMDLLGGFPGLPGVFIAAIFAAALSTVSSSINALSAVFLEDFIKPLKSSLGSPVNPKKEHIYAKVLSIFFGLLAIGMSYLAPILGDAIIQVPPTIFGAVGGPSYALFILGFFMRKANKWGVLAGSVFGLVIDLWFGIGQILYGVSPLDFNLPVGMCLANSTTMETPTTAMPLEEPNPLKVIYDVSYLWIGVTGVVLSVVSGIVFSYIFNHFGIGVEDDEIDPNLITSFRDLFSRKARKESYSLATPVEAETLMKLQPLAAENGTASYAEKPERNGMLESTAQP